MECFLLLPCSTNPERFSGLWSGPTVLSQRPSRFISVGLVLTGLHLAGQLSKSSAMLRSILRKFFHIRLDDINTWDTLPTSETQKTSTVLTA